MGKIKNALIDVLYNIIWMRTGYLFFFWLVGIYFILISGLSYRNHNALGRFLAEEEYHRAEGICSDVEFYEGRAGRGGSSPYVRIEFSDGRKFYQMSYNYHGYDWKEKLSGLHAGDKVELLVYETGSGKRDTKFISVSCNGKELLSLEEVRERCQIYFLKLLRQSKVEMVIGVTVLLMALGLTIFRRF